MIGKYLPPELITLEEAANLFEYATLSEMRRVEALYLFFIKNFKPDLNTRWGTLKVLSFIYDVARVQGIREERAKRKLDLKERV